MVLTAIATSRTDPSKAAAANALVTLDAQKAVAAGFAPATVENLAAPGGAESVLAVSNFGNVADHYHVAITGVSGPPSAGLIGLDGQPVSSIAGLYLAGFANGAIPLQATLGTFGQGQVTVDIVSETDAQVHAQAIVTIETTGGPSATPTPTVTPGPSEDCFNCIDDDGNGLTDRADPPARHTPTAAARGLAASPRRSRPARRRSGSPASATGPRCTSACSAAPLRWRSVFRRRRVTPRASPRRRRPARSRRMPSPPVPRALRRYFIIPLSSAVQPAAVKLDRGRGLGYGAEAQACAAVGANGVATLLDVFVCVERTHRCRAAQSLGADVPRLAELLGLGEIDALLACPVDGADAGGLGLGDAARGKAVDRCAAALGRGGVNLVRVIAQTLQRCSAAVFQCVPAAPGGCVMPGQGSSVVRQGGVACRRRGDQRAGEIPSQDLQGVRRAAQERDAGRCLRRYPGNEGIGYQAFESQCAALGCRRWRRWTTSAHAWSNSTPAAPSKC